MKIEKKDIKPHLPAMLEMAKIAKKIKFPILATIKVSGNTLNMTDLNQWLSVTLPVESTGDFLVPAKEFLDFMKLAKTSVTITLDAGNVTLEADGVKKTLISLPVADYPSRPEMPSLEYNTLPEGFIQGLEEVDHARSDDLSREAICGAAIECDGSESVLVATDGYRLAKKILPAVGYDFKGVIPGYCIPLLRKMTGTMAHASWLNPIPEGQKAETCHQTGYQAFKTANMELVIYDSRPRFPNWRQVLAKGEHTIALERKPLIEFCNSAIGLYKGIKNPSYTIKIAKIGGWLRLNAKTEKGEIETHVSFATAGQSGSDLERFRGFFIGVSAEYLKNALEVFTRDAVLMQVTDYSKPMVIESGNLYQIIMPMRLTALGEDELSPALEPKTV